LCLWYCLLDSVKPKLPVWFPKEQMSQCINILLDSKHIWRLQLKMNSSTFTIVLFLPQFRNMKLQW
jgi:hypothetical protein